MRAHGGGLEIARHIIAANHVEDHIGGKVYGFHRLDEILGAVIDRQIGAKRAAGLALLWRSGGDHDCRAQRLGQHDGGGADAARAAMDEQRLARLESPALENIGPHGEEGFGDGGRLPW
jgi:hypothetical protein